MSSTWTPKFKNYEFWMEQILLQDICPMGNSCSLLAFFSFFFLFLLFWNSFYLFTFYFHCIFGLFIGSCASSLCKGIVNLLHIIPIPILFDCIFFH